MVFILTVHDYDLYMNLLVLRNTANYYGTEEMSTDGNINNLTLF